MKKFLFGLSILLFPLSVFFNICWFEFLMWTRHSGLGPLFGGVIYGIPLGALNSFFLQPFLFSKMIKSSSLDKSASNRLTLCYALYMASTPFLLFAFFGDDLGPTQGQKMGGIFLCVVVPICYWFLFGLNTLLLKLLSKKKQS